MIPTVISAEPVGEHRLLLEFDDGTRGEVDVAALVSFVGVFEPLKDAATFRRVSVDADLGTIAWPNGADIDPLVLYARVRGVAVETLLDTEPSPKR